MAGSEAEERIRAKTEAALRARLPSARIIHELDLQCGVRIDLAAVAADQMIVAEIKSERDKLARLAKQAKAAERLGIEAWAVVAERWKDEAPEALRKERVWGCHIYAETPEGIEKTYPLPGYREKSMPAWCDYRALLSLLLAPEARALCKGIVKSYTPGHVARRHCLETMSGKAIREGVFAALRARHFARADAPVAP